jgi:CheY-like chemotaxis protein
MSEIEKHHWHALIVDDNWLIRDISSHTLKHIGYHVSEARNGQEALDLLADQPFDLLILDLLMPLVDGSTVLNRLRNNPNRHAMHIIILTANPLLATDQIRRDVDAVMLKPLNIREFADMARRYQAN